MYIKRDLCKYGEVYVNEKRPYTISGVQAHDGTARWGTMNMSRYDEYVKRDLCKWEET